MRYTDEQVMLSLAYVSYLGFYEPSTGLIGSTRTFESISAALRDVPSLEGAYRIAWGPAHERLPLTIFDDNLMFVAQSTRDPSRYVVVIRGTNPVSLTNWLLQDFSIVIQTPWPYNEHPGSLEPKLSRGTARGLQALQRMKPAKGLPGEGTNLYQFLGNVVYESAGRDINLCVTGHSLGGALAPALALWLFDTREHSDDPASPPWDRRRQVQIEVVPFAGPSPGNKDFAQYYDERLGTRTRRLWNRFDVVPHGWVATALAQLPMLYHPDIAPDWLMKIILRGALALAHGRDYVQIMSEALPLEGGRLSGVLREYLPEMIYQHTAAYCDLLRLTGEIDAIVHFDLDDSIRAAIERMRKAGDIIAASSPSNQPARAARAAAPSTGPLGDSVQAARVQQRMSTFGAPWFARLHRAYRVPASIILPMLPKAMALSDLRRRQSHYAQSEARA